MAGLHTRKTVIVGYSVGFVAILGCLLIKQKENAAAPSRAMATELDVDTTDDAKSFEPSVGQKYKPTKKPTQFRAPVQGVYHIHTGQELVDFVAKHTDKPVVVKFANKKACSPCKALAPTYLLSAKFLPDKAYFAEIEENEFDDLEYFAELAPIIPAFKIYVNGELVPVKEFQGLRSRTHIKEELEQVQQEETRKRAMRSRL